MSSAAAGWFLLKRQKKPFPRSARDDIVGGVFSSLLDCMGLEA